MALTANLNRPTHQPISSKTPTPPPTTTTTRTHNTINTNNTNNAQAGNSDCDHMHDGLGFLTNHGAQTVQFEQALQSINPRVKGHFNLYSNCESDDVV